MLFEEPDGSISSVGAYWYTTLVPNFPIRQLPMDKLYAGRESEYPTYVNYDAIEVSRIADIPGDYNGKMGVPITFLEFYDPRMWISHGTNATVLEDAEQDPEIKANSHLYRRHNLYIEQENRVYKYKRCYDRLIISRRPVDGKH